MASHSSAADSHDDHGHGLSHVASAKILVSVFVVLLCLTLLTVFASHIDFGSRAADIGVALVIAVIKASLVILYFMHLRYDRPFHSVLVCVGLLAAALFVTFTLVDRSQYEDQVIWSTDPCVRPAMELAPLPPSCAQATRPVP